MRCLVTAGPTVEPLDRVRRLTNFSTGRLGTTLALHLAGRGHEVVLLRSEASTWPFSPPALGQLETVTFTSTASLRQLLERLAGLSMSAVFHAAAVADFRFGRVFRRASAGEPSQALTEVTSGKIRTSDGPLLAELLPTPKLISSLRDWFPQAWIAGWKYEVEGDRDSVIARARAQIASARTEACVANGPAYGSGYGLVLRGGTPLHHCADATPLFEALERTASESR